VHVCMVWSQKFCKSEISLDTGSERRTQNPSGVDSGSGPTSGPSMLTSSRGVWSLKFLTPTPLLVWLNILRHILKFRTPTPAQTPRELCKLMAVSERPYPVFALKRPKKTYQMNLLITAIHVSCSSDKDLRWP